MYKRAGVIVMGITPNSPIQQDLFDVNAEQIEKFNQSLKSGLDSRITWIDSYSYLTENGFSSSDGLHYNNATYTSLYNYYISIVG